MERDEKDAVMDALDCEEFLTQWESAFINSIADKPDSYTLSESQRNILNQIQEKLERQNLL